MHAMPLLLAILCLMAIAYRYYSAFLAAKVATLDDLRQTPAHRLNDGQNYDPTNKWVLFGHHFAAISGAGPLIGPVLAAQFGYLPGLIWIVVGVCLAGAVQDFLVLVASMRRGGRSLAQIAMDEIGPVAGWAATFAVLFIIIVALAGLGKVVVKALGGEEVKYPPGSVLFHAGLPVDLQRNADGNWIIPGGMTLFWNDGKSSMPIHESFLLKVAPSKDGTLPALAQAAGGSGTNILLPANAARLVPGSSWGTFTIACTIPIALFVGLYMYKLRKGRVVEASLIGATLTIGATVVGGFIPGSPIEHWFNLPDKSVVVAMAIYGFIASVLPVWVLLCPRDYLSSFLKIGTIILLVAGTLIANPKLEAPAFNSIFAGGGPTVAGQIFPFLFITIMCGAISGFHSLVSSGTTPKMISKESHARTIGYGAMLIEGLVGVVAMIAAAALPTQDYYAMNTDLAKVPAYHDRILQVGGGGGIEHISTYEQRTQESLRGRTGGAVTLAVGMATIFDTAMAKLGIGIEAMWKYWYHFAIMFEALFILTTIDAGTRVGRFLLQELFGKFSPRLGRTDWWPGAVLSTAVIVAGWGYLIQGNSMDAIWPMFGIANQMLAAIAMAVLSVVLLNEGKSRYLWVTVAPMLLVLTTTSTAAAFMLSGQWVTMQTQFAKPAGTLDWTILGNSLVRGGLIVVMLACGYVVIATAMWRLVAGGGTGRGAGFQIVNSGRIDEGRNRLL